MKKETKSLLHLIEHVQNYPNNVFKQEIELQSRVSLSQKAQGGQISSKKEIKIHLIDGGDRDDGDWGDGGDWPRGDLGDGGGDVDNIKKSTDKMWNLPL